MHDAIVVGKGPNNTLIARSKIINLKGGEREVEYSHLWLRSPQRRTGVQGKGKGERGRGGGGGGEWGVESPSHLHGCAEYFVCEI